MRICLKLSDGWQKPFPVREVYEKMKTRICSSPQGTFIHSFFSRLAPTLSRPCSKTSGKANKASPTTRHPFSKACLQHSRTIIQPCMWFMEEPIQFPVGQTAQSLTCNLKGETTYMMGWLSENAAGTLYKKDVCPQQRARCTTGKHYFPPFHSEWWRKKDQKVLPFKPAMMNASALQFRSRAVL